MTRNFPNMPRDMYPGYDEYRGPQFGEYARNPIERMLYPRGGFGGYPPFGYPSYGYPSYGYPSYGYPSYGYPPFRNPSFGYPPYGYPSNRYPR